MKKTFTLFLLLVISNTIFAVPANPEPGIVSYPDGSELSVYLRGDENRSWHETEDGHHIIKNKSGLYEYIEMAVDGLAKPSGVVAHTPGQRSFQEKKFIASLPELIIYPANMQKAETMAVPAPAPAPTVPFDQTDFPTLGDKKFLLILVEFADVSFTHSATNFDSLMNGENYTHNGAIGSVRKYYNATSFDRFNPNFDVVGPVVLDSGYAYYGRNNDNGNDENMQLFIREAINKADPLVDYAQYDNDNDGYVDNVYFIYAGYGECFYGADENTIWPHRWAFIGSQPSLDGKTFYDYSTSMEFHGISGTSRTNIGVVCHEFGHVCGLPDFYDTDYDGSGGNCGGLGYWDEMAGGSWNDNGRKPPIFNAWSRMYLRWSEPIELLQTENVTLNPAHSHNEVRYFFSQTDDEFFFMENRQRVGWDAAIPGHGLLIFHIDMNSSRWNDNSLNCNPYRQAFDLEEADGQGNITSSKIDAGDPFPGTSGNTSFLDTGSPNAQDWVGQASRSSIKNITENGNIINFIFDDYKPSNLVISSISEDSLHISWKQNDSKDPVIVLCSKYSDIQDISNNMVFEIGDIIENSEVIYKGLDTVFYHTELNNGMIYYYAIASCDSNGYVKSNNVINSGRTQSPIFYTTDFSKGLPEGWVIFDRYGNGTFSMDNPENRTIASSTAGNGFMVMDSEYAGAVQIDAEMITQSYNFALSRSVIVKFEHRLEVTSATLARLLYTINNGLSWVKVANWEQNTTDPEITEVDLSAEISGFRDVKFKFNYKATNEKYWCIDDFEISAAQDTGLSAGFHTANISGSKPLTVHFMNTSISNPDSIDSYVWEFGDDGMFYYEKDPVHTYTRSGLYSVLLTTIKDGKTSYCQKDNYIEVSNDAPVVINEEDTLNVAKNIPNTYNLNRFFMDPNGDPLTYTWSGNSADLTINLQDDSLIVFTPGTDYLGTETVTIVAKDNENDSTSHTVNVWVSETGISDAIPDDFRCDQNYPNPFNPSTSIRYQLPENRYVNLYIYDLSGHKIRTLINGIQDAGYYTVQFHAGDLPSGMYLYRLTAGNEMITKKMVLMK